MKRLALALILTLFATAASAQCNGIFATGQVCGNNTGSNAPARPTPFTSFVPAGEALTRTDDTNVTLTLTGTPASALLEAVNIAVGWTGQLAYSRGGTNASTQIGARDNIFPSATTAGTIAYWDGTIWTVLAGNTSGTRVLQETSSGVPSWVVPNAGDVVGPGSSTDNAAARFDSTTGKLIQNSALIVADTTAALSRSGAGGIPVQGTNTNDNAAAGDIGELMSNSPGATSLTTNTPANCAQFTLTAGDWDIYLGGFFSGAGTTTTTDVRLGINTTSATLPVGNPPLQFFEFRVSSAITDFIFGPSLGPFRVSISGSTTYYGVGQATFSVSTFSVNCTIRARRVR